LSYKNNPKKNYESLNKSFFEKRDNFLKKKKKWAILSKKRKSGLTKVHIPSYFLHLAVMFGICHDKKKTLLLDNLLNTANLAFLVYLIVLDSSTT
jgi:hypothetical protein